MSLFFPLTPPSVPGYRTLTPRVVPTVGRSRSPFSGQMQVYEWPGEWIEFDVALPSMTLAQSGPWEGFLAACRGGSGTFLLGDTRRRTPRGPALGTPLVNGSNAAQSKTLATKGWTAGQTGVLMAGDWLQVGSGSTQRIYMVVQDANSDGSGLATFDIFPRLREALSDAAAITIASTKGVFRMAQNAQEWPTDEALLVGMSFKAVEAI